MNDDFFNQKHLLPMQLNTELEELDDIYLVRTNSEHAG
jgi:hypothetical protein